ncbi:MAG: UDP-N-acetylmuramoyl-L-alanyl-D-glutamate--2,6-diaminopimelate ligase [Alphaproteobacteria bacterium]|nr:UDP-N-acetylmuramoyl-L-alanyl-D-glutamate--2,6-diaminopimelate ligase [Alphaproteobacteria bacterium]
MIDLNTLRQKLGLSETPDTRTVSLRALTHDGRLATEHHLFMPLPRCQGSIPDFINQAISKGCQAMLVDHAMVQSLRHVPEHFLLIVPDFYQALSMIYPLFYGSLPTHRVAITGTDGKTSVAHILHQLWNLTNKPNASIGTIGLFSSPALTPPFAMHDGMTTQPQPILYHALSWYKDHGVDHAVFEASSHALAQERLNPLRVPVAIFTNFAQDHLDYHGNLYAYWQAKWRLFTHSMIDGPAFALISNTIPLFTHDQKRIKSNVSVIRYGQDTGAVSGADNATYRIISRSFNSQQVLFDVMGHQWKSEIPLIGGFQIHNVLAAILAFVCTGGTLDELIPVLPNLTPVLGRMEHVAQYNGAHIYVDYSHTPQGIEMALRALRPSTPGQLGIVFGCGGDRDALKRPLMGQAAQKYSDWVVVTDDNPRREDPADIRQHILVGCPDAQSISPRSAALAHAISRLKPGDALLVAGKGHETTQTIGHHVLEHSDHAWIQSYCEKTQ